MLVHKHAKKLTKYIFSILDAPMSPHWGLAIGINNKPLHLYAVTQCIPKPLPVESFKPKWDLLNDFEKLKAHRKALGKARYKLNMHKAITGVGILGKPVKELKEDPKYDSILEDSIAVGEQLALASLTAE